MNVIEVEPTLDSPPTPAAMRLPRARIDAWVIAAALALVGGLLLRIVPWMGFHGRGFDEALYEEYLGHLIKDGLGGYPDLVDGYIEYQKTLIGSILPPTRFLYIFCAYLWHGVFGGEPLACFHAVSRCFSVLTLLLAGLFARRLFADRRLALGVFALFAFSPLQIHMAQHALADGFFEFFALLTLWALWECLQCPGHRGWLTAYAAGLACMVLTKENAFFVFAAVLALLAANRWLRFGTINRPLLVMTFVGPMIGVAILANLAGGLGTLCNVYLLSVPKNMLLPYAIATGDGPWYRYLLDLMAFSPLVLILALAMIFQVRRDDKPLIFLLIFVGVSYLIMANLKYGMNLRYATMWDLPLRALAVTQVGLLSARFGRWQQAAWAAVIVGLCLFDLHQYKVLAVDFRLYELIPKDIMRALHILK